MPNEFAALAKGVTVSFVPVAHPSGTPAPVDEPEVQAATEAIQAGLAALATAAKQDTAAGKLDTINATLQSRNGVPASDISAANTEKVVSMAAGAAGKKNKLIGLSAVTGGAAVGAAGCLIQVKEGATVLYATSIPAGAAIGTSLNILFPVPLVQPTAATQLDVSFGAAGAGCTIRGSILGFTE